MLKLVLVLVSLAASAQADSCLAEPGSYCDTVRFALGPNDATGIKCPQGTYCPGGDAGKKDCTCAYGWYCPEGSSVASGEICPQGYSCAGGTADKVVQTSAPTTRQPTPAPITAPTPAPITAPTPAPITRPTPKKGSYEMLAKGASGCPKGLEIKTQAECNDAIRSLGYTTGSGWKGSYTRIPRFCTFRVSTKSPHWNTASSGRGRSDLQPICKKQKEDTEWIVVAVGSSNRNPKAVSVPGAVAADNKAVNPQHSSWRDTFDVTVTGTGISVRRTDRTNIGWGQSLKLRVQVNKIRGSSKDVIVTVGSSGRNGKTVKVPGVVSVVDPTPQNWQHSNWRDRFKVDVDRKNSQIKVTRLDANSGWGQTLQIKAQVSATCPSGFRTGKANHCPDSPGSACCLKSWTATCGSTCAAQMCYSAGGKWIPKDYSRNSYTCQILAGAGGGTTNCKDDDSSKAWIAAYSCNQLKSYGFCTSSAWSRKTKQRCPKTCGTCTAFLETEAKPHQDVLAQLEATDVEASSMTVAGTIITQDMLQEPKPVLAEIEATDVEASSMTVAGTIITQDMFPAGTGLHRFFANDAAESKIMVEGTIMTQDQSEVDLA